MKTKISQREGFGSNVVSYKKGREQNDCALIA